MDFESWFNRTPTVLRREFYFIQRPAKDIAKEAWQASRENMQELTMLDFCQAVNCPELYNQTDCVAPEPCACNFSAKEFHHWLRDNGYRIVKD